MVIEKRIERVARMAQLGTKRIGRDFVHSNGLFCRQRMLRGSDHDEFVTMDHLRLEAIVIYGQRDYAEVAQRFRGSSRESGHNRNV